MKILIIDDEKEVAEIFKEKLEKSGHQVLTARNGEQGLELAQKEKPSLILLDIIMPKLNGLDVLKRLKQNEETKDIAVYILTNLPPEAGEEQAKKLGASKYIFKAENEPLTIVELINGIKNET